MNKSFIDAVIKHEILKRRISFIANKSYKMDICVCSGLTSKSNFNLRELNKNLINRNQ